MLGKSFALKCIILSFLASISGKFSVFKIVNEHKLKLIKIGN